jgi:hypothetical protein
MDRSQWEVDRPSFLVEAERGGVDAISQAGGVGTIREDMAEMASTTGAGDLRAGHAMAAVLVLLNIFLIERIVKARPAAPGVELGFRWEKFEATSGTEINSGSAGGSILASEWALGALLAQDTVLLRSERTTPFFIRLANLVHGLRSFLTLRLYALNARVIKMMKKAKKLPKEAICDPKWESREVSHSNDSPGSESLRDNQ